jgi:UPF0716 protein FxsA
MPTCRSSTFQLCRIEAFMWIFVALVAVPIVEIALFIRVGGWLGLWPTLGLVVLTAIVGGSLLRQQGLATVEGLRREMSRGGDPSPLLVQGALLLVGGVLLLTPGFFTDAVGLALLIPPVREALVAWAGPRIAARIVTVHTRRGPAGHTASYRYDDRGPAAQPGPIDAEYHEIETPPPGRNPHPPRD